MDADTWSGDGRPLSLSSSEPQDARNVSYDVQQHGSVGRSPHDTPKPRVRQSSRRCHRLR